MAQEQGMNRAALDKALLSLSNSKLTYAARCFFVASIGERLCRAIPLIGKVIENAK